MFWQGSCITSTSLGVLFLQSDQRSQNSRKFDARKTLSLKCSQPLPLIALLYIGFKMRGYKQMTLYKLDCLCELHTNMGNCMIVHAH